MRLGRGTEQVSGGCGGRRRRRRGRRTLRRLPPRRRHPRLGGDGSLSRSPGRRDEGIVSGGVRAESASPFGGGVRGGPASPIVPFEFQFEFEFALEIDQTPRRNHSNQTRRRRQRSRSPRGPDENRPRRTGTLPSPPGVGRGDDGRIGSHGDAIVQTAGRRRGGALSVWGHFGGVVGVLLSRRRNDGGRETHRCRCRYQWRCRCRCGGGEIGMGDGSTEEPGGTHRAGERGTHRDRHVRDDRDAVEGGDQAQGHSRRVWQRGTQQKERQ
mmetsp:Transcript_1565/g.3532  ORF Transcript_1565/g.3532 Transcript_1565/m.3532 type:complete len:269 (-) Transcript_1565:1364-2170(-)